MRLAAFLSALALCACAAQPEDKFALAKLCRDPDYKLVQDVSTKKYVLIFNNGWTSREYDLSDNFDPKAVCS